MTPTLCAVSFIAGASMLRRLAGNQLGQPSTPDLLGPGAVLHLVQSLATTPAIGRRLALARDPWSTDGQRRGADRGAMRRAPLVCGD